MTKKIIIFLCLLCFPSIVFGMTRLRASNQNPYVGSDVYIQLEIDYGHDKLIDIVHYAISYDHSILEYSGVVWNQSIGSLTERGDKIYIDKDKNSSAWQYGYLVQLKFKVKAAGKTLVKIEETAPAYFSDGNVVAQMLSNITLSAEKPNDDVKLKSLYVKDNDISPVFNKNRYNYNLTVASNISEVEVIALKSNDKQTITGAGKKKLNYGDNKVVVTVTAQSGKKQNYQIMIKREDDRSGDTSLKYLNVSGTNISYDQNKDVYEATVSKSVDNVLITAMANDTSSTVIGTGQKNLVLGYNRFELKVESTKGLSKTYVINILRSNEEIKENIPSTELSYLRINDIVFDIQKVFLYSVSGNVNKLNVYANTKSTTAKIKIEGNDNLKVGLNEILITVSDEGDISDTYRVIVYKNTAVAMVVDSINSYFKNNLIMNKKVNDNHIINLNYLKDNKLYYNVLNETNGLLYQVLLNNKNDNISIDFSLNRLEDNMLTYEMMIPAGNQVLLYVGDDFYDNENVRIYTFDENKYELLTAGATVVKGYISFETNGARKYVFTRNVLVKETTFWENMFNKYKLEIIIFGIILGIFIVIQLVVYFIKRKKEKEYEGEPLY